MFHIQEKQWKHGLNKKVADVIISHLKDDVVVDL